MDAIQVIAENRKARHEYYIEDVIEAGIVLQGTEVKSVRGRRVNLKDSYAKVENNEVFLYGMHISPYEQGNRFNHDPLRVRKLLLNRSEIRRLIGITREKGMALIPLRLYFRRGLVKVELAVARGKKLYDKRQDLAERSAQRDIERAFRERQRAE
ncbi:MAG TPA: SsrA-binding protein SmpB [Bacillota bacterium]|jgi:SsrA-binding protein|nr:SsrA-binding protein SmpB [Bacillota bacterium]HPZ22931.1 SsrA-binding protein SmpB [Bacillota bacterium]HQD20583.1 SsrA-binding protein SmpB [Bacillota bacterium]